jgi:hypothetical protein
MDNTWLAKRNCGIHMTIRDVDCEHFDAERMAREFHEMGVSYFSFFAGGYVTTYPSKLPESRISPWLGERDVTGDIIRASHKYGIKAIAMADFSVLAPDVYRVHPEWAMVDASGKPYETISGMYTACVMGDYARDYGRRMVAEILGTYDVDGMKFGGGSYGFNANICHCEKCRAGFFEMFHEQIPARRDWDDPVWKKYHSWRTAETGKRVRFLHELVSRVNPDMPVMGNGVCFSDTAWTMNSALDMEDMAQHQDMIQIEAQTRYWMKPEIDGGEWQSAFWTGEEAAYMTNVTDKPIWIVTSYFKAWPWRRSAIDYAEQKAYLAQIAANGASPMVNLSGGPPAAHEDKRGFRAPTEIWRFVRDHNPYFSFDRSGAEVAFVYSADSMTYYGKDKPDERYVRPLRGYEEALLEAHIPFDIISDRTLTKEKLARYKALILTGYTCMSEREAAALEAFVADGGSLISSFESALYTKDGVRRPDFLLGSLFGIKFLGVVENVNGPDPGGRQNYLRLRDADHPLFEGFSDAGLIPVAGQYCRVSATAGDTPMALAQPFIIFPEGLSYATEPDWGFPGAVTREHPAGGRTVYFSAELDRMHHAVGFTEIAGLLANAVRWAVKNDVPVSCDAPDSVLITLRLQNQRANVHLINRTGGRRMLRQFVSVRDITIRLADRVKTDVSRVFSLSSGEEFPVRREAGFWVVTLPTLLDYDVIVFE